MTLSTMVGMLLAASGPEELVPAYQWPLHRTLRELWEASRRTGVALPGLHLVEFSPDPDVGVRVSGVEEALWALRGRRVLVPVGLGREARLRVTDGELTEFRRLLVGLDPDAADLVYCAGSRWAALVATSAKKARAPAASSSPRVASDTPKRLKRVLPAGC